MTASPQVQAAVRATDGELYLVYERERRAYRVADAFTIGRDTESDLVVMEPTVSRTHARVKAEDGAWLLECLGPTGTRVNGMKIEQPHALAYGDRIEVGTAVFTVRTAPLPLGVTLVERDESVRILDAVTARRPTIRHPLMTERPVEKKRNWGMLAAVVIAVLLLFAALAKV